MENSADVNPVNFDELMEMLGDDEETEVRLAACESLENGTDEVIRMIIPEALGNIGSKDYLEMLTKLSNDPSSYTRREAKDALKKIKINI